LSLENEVGSVEQADKIPTNTIENKSLIVSSSSLGSEIHMIFTSDGGLLQGWQEYGRLGVALHGVAPVALFPLFFAQNQEKSHLLTIT